MTLNAIYLAFCHFVHTTFHNCGQLSRRNRAMSTRLPGGTPLRSERPFSFPLADNYPKGFCGQADLYGGCKWKGLWKNRTGVRSGSSTLLSYACYQGVFKVKEAAGAPGRTAPILAEAPFTNNERAGVIHRLCKRESRVFHIIHRFQTFFAVASRKAPLFSWKPADRTHSRRRVLFDTCRGRSV